MLNYAFVNLKLAKKECEESKYFSGIIYFQLTSWNFGENIVFYMFLHIIMRDFFRWTRESMVTYRIKSILRNYNNNSGYETFFI